MQVLNLEYQDSFAISSVNRDENHEQSISKSALPEILEFHNNSHEYTKNKSEQQLEFLISNLLKYGVFTACFTVFVGGVLYLAECGLEPVDYHFFEGQPSVFHAPMLVVNGVLSGSHYSIILFGLLLLIAIPIIRVVISLVTFFRQGDFTYTLMTSIALSGLIYSFIAAY
jgi:uncharacterized membrane protein